MKCKDVQPKLVEFSEHLLEQRLQSQVNAHVQICSTCAQELQDIEETITLLKSVPMEEPPESFWEDFSSDVMAKVYAADPPVRRRRLYALPRFKFAMGFLAVLLLLGGIAAYVAFQQPVAEKMLTTSELTPQPVIEATNLDSAEHGLRTLVSEELAQEILRSELALFDGTLPTALDVGYNDEMVDVLLSGLTSEEKRMLLVELRKIRKKAE